MRSLFLKGSTVLTGVTGFVGRQLIKELLLEQAGPIVCLLRGHDDAQVQQRGLSICANPRVLYLRGDIEQSRLGLAPGVWQALADATEAIYHCAGSNSLHLRLDDALRVNRDGTAAVLALACAAASSGRFSAMHHLSTAYAAGKTTATVAAGYLPAADPSEFRNHFEFSKAEAERLLMAQQDIPVVIYRPSMIGGHSMTGVTDQWNFIYEPMRLLCAGQVRQLVHNAPFVLTSKRLGAASGRFDCVAVDYVARAMVALGRPVATPAGSNVRHYHLTAGARAPRVLDLIRACDRSANTSHCRLVGSMRWQALGFAARLSTRWQGTPRWLQCWGRRELRSRRRLQPHLAYLNVQSQFCNVEEQAFLERFRICMPDPLRYLHTLVGFARQHSFELEGSRRAQTHLPHLLPTRRTAQYADKFAGGWLPQTP